MLLTSMHFKQAGQLFDLLPEGSHFPIFLGLQNRLTPHSGGIRQPERWQIIMLNISCADLAIAVTAWEMKIQTKMKKNPSLNCTQLRWSHTFFWRFWFKFQNIEWLSFEHVARQTRAWLFIVLVVRQQHSHPHPSRRREGAVLGMAAVWG